ncbi:MULTISPECIES: LysE family transporter [Streptomyces]|uniref:LysE family transporter n=1 Tax=Streptomyces siderophoricus TaxID=2802281 RepID=A0ABS1N537_9ACTN|nr:LysE family transporter [Streptomyces sp. 9-7]MBL1095006.1 LysE family transporter [Streptomyces sp. 9-7]
MTEAILSGLWAGYGLAMPVGAVAVLMVDLTARTSFRVGATAALGAATADAFYAIAAAVGGSALADTIQPFTTPLRWVASVILVLMAIRISVTAVRNRRESGNAADEQDSQITPFRSYLTYLALTALNPWPAVYFAALLLGQQANGDISPSNQAAYVIAIVFASASWQLLLAGGGTVLGRVLTSQRGRMITALVSSGVIISLAVGVVA